MNTEVEDKKFTSLSAEHSESAEGHVHSPRSCDTKCSDHIVETGLHIPEQQSTSATKESLELKCNPVEEMKSSDQPMPSVEMSVDVPDEVCIKVNKTNGHATNNLTLKDNSGIAPTEKPAEAEKDIEDGTKFSALSGELPLSF